MASAGSQSLHQSTYSSCSRSFIFNPQKQQDEPASAPASTQMKRPSHSCQTVQKLVLSRCAFHRKEPAVLRSRRAIVHGYQTHMFSMEAFAVSCSRVADTKSTTGACRLMLATSSCMKAPCRVMLHAYTQRRLQANLDKWHMHVQTEALAVKSGSEAQTHTHTDANRGSCCQVRR